MAAAPIRILCVCTGNTCRSPMLAALLEDACHRRRVPARIESAGIAAYGGQPAAPPAVHCMAERGLDIGRHASRSCDELDPAAYDHILCMEPAHAARLSEAGAPPERVVVVDAERGGVPDPFGLELDDYRRCADCLARAAETIAAELATGP